MESLMLIVLQLQLLLSFGRYFFLTTVDLSFIMETMKLYLMDLLITFKAYFQCVYIKTLLSSCQILFHIQSSSSSPTFPYNILIMFQFFSSFGASTNFEKYRLEITAKNFQAPNEQSLREILSTFSGQDPETKSEIAFATIVKKLLTSDSKNNWVYLLKNLIVFDRVVEEGLFTEEISTLQVATLDGFKEADQRNMYFDSERVIASFWRLIKEKSKVLAKGDHIFCNKRSQRTIFLAKLKAHDLLIQLQSIEDFFELVFELVGYLSGKKLLLEQPKGHQRIERGRDDWDRSRLLEYLYFQVLHKLMLFYSCQLLCNQSFLQLLPRNGSLGVEEVRSFKKHVVKFRQNANQYVRFVEARKSIKGFEQLNYKQLNPYKGDDIIRLLDAFIQQKEKETDPESHPFIESLHSNEEMHVEKKPFAGLNKDVLVPRIRHKEKESKQGPGSNSFVSWVSSYSNSFPQSEVLSVDLIMAIREQENKENGMEGDEAVDDSNRESVIYGGRDTNVASDFQLIYKLGAMGKPVAFRNQFSELPSKWNT